jgi:UDP-3-O-[3-hydroxymyristoyl] N-acetylglucosamine deacetylase / 3-hydroxyacyl-[acyl-carrier-protein] dehydratase
VKWPGSLSNLMKPHQSNVEPQLENSPAKPETSDLSKRGQELSEQQLHELATASSLNIEQVMQILPHRYPFLMVDKIVSFEETKIRAIKNVTINEPYFQGHFPGKPVMPGVLQLEAIAQVAGMLTLRKKENVGKPAYFMSADKVKWRKPVLPGDTLVIDVEVLRSRGKIGKARGVCSVDGVTVSEAEVTFMIAG